MQFLPPTCQEVRMSTFDKPASAGQQQKDQADADKAAASKRASEIKDAASAVAAQRAAEDEEVAERRQQEDTALAESRRDADRVVASARTRLTVAAAAMEAEVALAGTPSADPAELRVVNSELQTAITDHLGVTPEPVKIAKAES
jgi:hypothetical protein